MCASSTKTWTLAQFLAYSHIIFLLLEISNSYFPCNQTLAFPPSDGRRPTYRVVRSEGCCQSGFCICTWSIRVSSSPKGPVIEEWVLSKQQSVLCSPQSKPSMCFRGKERGTWPYNTRYDYHKQPAQNFLSQTEALLLDNDGEATWQQSFPTTYPIRYDTLHRYLRTWP